MRFIFLVSLFLLLPGAASSAELTIIVNQLRNSSGDVHIAVYNDADTFPDSDGMITETKIPARQPAVTWTFKNLSPGRYAVAVYHDENGNDEFDQGLFGIPLEGYAFSNNAAVFLGPPDFAEAAIDVKNTVQHTITMDY